MEKGYYKPEIKEFCIGFEYEVKLQRHTSGTISETVWSQCKFGFRSKGEDILKGEAIKNNECFIDNLQPLISSGYIRVKYLDKDDIKYLGWKMRAEAVSGGNPNNPTLIFKMDTYELRYTISENGIPCISIKDTYVDYQHFSGFIKNKSNLKTLMQWTNIIRQQ